MILSGLVNTIPTVLAGSASVKPSSRKVATKAASVANDLLDQIVLTPPGSPPAAASSGPAPVAAPAPAPSAAAAVTAAVPPAASAVPSFITAASLASVSGGTAVITLLWQVARTLIGPPAATPWVPFACALLVGGAIYWLSVGDQNVRMSTREQVVGVFIAFVNSMVLFSAALGISGHL